MFLSKLTLLVVSLALLLRVLQQPTSQHEQPLLLDKDTASNVLLLTAHPDDECMFFGPTLTSLLQNSGSSSTQPAVSEAMNVFSLCLSAGGADGLGDIRKEELGSSLDVLGIDQLRRWLVDHPYVCLQSHSFTSYSVPFVLRICIVAANKTTINSMSLTSCI